MWFCSWINLVFSVNKNLICFWCVFFFLDVSHNISKNKRFWNKEVKKGKNIILFWTGSPLTIEKIKILKTSKKARRYHHFTQVYKNHDYMHTVPEMWCMTDELFFILGYFLPFLPLLQPKKSKLKKKKKKKIPGDITILHKCIKNHDNMLYCSWDMVYDRCFLFFYFGLLFALLAP